jgi:hypothetical protein
MSLRVIAALLRLARGSASSADVIDQKEPTIFAQGVYYAIIGCALGKLHG